MENLGIQTHDLMNLKAKSPAILYQCFNYGRTGDVEVLIRDMVTEFNACMESFHHSAISFGLLQVFFEFLVFEFNVQEDS